MNILNDIINNAKSTSSLTELNQDVCISIQPNGIDVEVCMVFDSGEVTIVKLSKEQTIHLAMMLQKHLKIK